MPQSTRRSATATRMLANKDCPPKTPSACLTCRKKKVKCSGTAPCDYCSRRGFNCTVPDAAPKRDYFVSRIEELEGRLAQYEKAKSTPQTHTASDQDGRRISVDMHRSDPFSPTGISQVEGSSSSRILSGRGFIPQSENSDFAESPRQPVGESTQPSPQSVIAADASLSSSHIFGSRVQDLLENPRPPPYERTPPPSDTSMSERRQASLASWHPTQHGSLGYPQFPSEDEAYRLLGVVNLIIGQTQHHFDVRDFSDRLGVFFADRTDPTRTSALWYLEMILVFAIGKLFGGDFDGDPMPGSSLFDYAHRALPSLSELYSHERIGVEVLGLIAVYLQNASRKEEAYIYISTALRIAVSHGFHRFSRMKHLLRSERVHLNRLWWTIYIQERRLAAATGNPSSISDEAIELDMPANALGFSPAAPIRVNIQIARVTGRIITTLYGRDLQPEEAFVPNVQAIVKSLHEISVEIPSDLTKNVDNLTPNLSLRTSAYLHLMLYQAILLTIRPIMLHVARLILSGTKPDSTDLINSPLGRLSQTCTEAARRLLEVVIALRKENLLAIFGFFDFDATFSAAFIMILAAIFDSACEERQKINPSPGLNDALETLQYLSDRGNPFAMDRLKEIHNMWSHLPVYPQMPNGHFVSSAFQNRSTARIYGSNTLDGLLSATEQQERRQANPETSGGQVSETAQPSNTQPDILDTEFWDSIYHLWVPQTENQDGSLNTELPAMNMSMENSGNSYHSLFNNPDWALTGEDTIDFAELGRYILNHRA